MHSFQLVFSGVGGVEAFARHELASMLCQRHELPRESLAGMIATLVDVFADDSVLLVFVVMAVAAALGAIRLKGVALF